MKINTNPVYRCGLTLLELVHWHLHIYNPRNITFKLCRLWPKKQPGFFLFVDSVKVSNRVRLFSRRALEALPPTGFHWGTDFEECLLQFTLCRNIMYIHLLYESGLWGISEVRRPRMGGGLPEGELSQKENCSILDFPSKSKREHSLVRYCHLSKGWVILTD